ncbi:MAG: ATP-dependent 6-phosphofructokinase [Oscillospiraceae bacterium]|nr:ATP-dependent 6-phosphofructokinase [Oscillospiraceae bacterium]
MMKIGLLTSGGDCQGLNAALRGVAKTLFKAVPYVELYGIQDGYRGLIECKWRKMKLKEFSGILREGGTILGTSKQPYRTKQDIDEHIDANTAAMIRNYQDERFEALIVLGGNKTQKTAFTLSRNGVNVVTLPKTIDNDLCGTDYTFGFDSAVTKAVEFLDAIHTTAAAHGRIFVIELMGNKAGWVTLYAGLAGSADVILVPEIPYSLGSVIGAINKRIQLGKGFSIIAIAEGAISREEAAMSTGNQEFEPEPGRASSGAKLVRMLGEKQNQDIRLLVPGHFQRGGAPTPHDRVLCLRMGAKAGELILRRQYGCMVALQGTSIGYVPLSDVAGKTKTIPPDSEVLEQARMLGISLGE